MKKTAITALTLVIAAFFPTVTYASYFTLPVGVNPATDISAWFDHDSGASSFLRYDGDTTDNYDGHNGTDFATSTGADVLAPATGVVKEVYWDNCGGWQMHVWHANIGLSTLYSHLGTTTAATTTNTVSRGEHIADVDVTGSCTSGPHLHFGVTDGENRATSNRIDPFGWTGGGSDPWTYDLGYLWTSNPPVFPYYWHEDFETYATGTVPAPWVGGGTYPAFGIVNSNANSGSKAGSNSGSFGYGAQNIVIDLSTLTGGFIASVAYKSVDTALGGTQSYLLAIMDSLRLTITPGSTAVCYLYRGDADEGMWVNGSLSGGFGTSGSPRSIFSEASTTDGNYHIYDMEIDVINSRCRGRADSNTWSDWTGISTTAPGNLASTTHYVWTAYQSEDDIAYFDDLYIYPK